MNIAKARQIRRTLAVAVLCILSYAVCAAPNSPERRSWLVEGVRREALVFAPASARTNTTPLVFVFHGHGGSMYQAARSLALHTLWPEAITVYPQGLNTPGGLVDTEGRLPGWQLTPGSQNDRDLKFFDLLLLELSHEYRVDRRRIHATGHSNGGAFTYLLWATRGEHFAAVAPSAAPAGVRLIPRLKPKPVLHVAGEKDSLVKFSWQKLTLEALRRLNQCGEGRPWASMATEYPSPLGCPVVAFIHPGGHEFPAAARPAIVKFFQEHPVPAQP